MASLGIFLSSLGLNTYSNASPISVSTGLLMEDGTFINTEDDNYLIQE